MKSDQPDHANVRKAVVMSCCMMFAEGFVATMIFPFAAFMVRESRGTDENLGAMTGLLFTAYPVGSMMSARSWGDLANRHGRRPCVLASLTAAAVLAVATGLSTDFRLLLVFRWLQGLTNCSLLMTRTFLRERVNALGGDEVAAFAALQASFGASSLTGPAFGGFLYGLGGQVVSNWAVPQLAALMLYISMLIGAFFCMPETGKLDEPKEGTPPSTASELLRERSFKYFLVMVAGHSFVFTGWEVGYPLFARDTTGLGEAWSTQMIGVTFVVGSTGLMLSTLFCYSAVEKRIGLSSIWLCSWILALIAIPLFPRFAARLMEDGVSTASKALNCLNYGTQFLVSSLLGSNFLTLQLMLNRMVGLGGNSEIDLPIANSWMVFAQALARTFSPVTTGAIFTASHAEAWRDGAILFDCLTAIGAIACLLFGCLFLRIFSSFTSSMDSLLRYSAVSSVSSV